MPLRVQVVTPEREVEVCDDASFVLAHGIEGDIGILAGHAPLLIALGVGELALDRPSGRDRMAVSGGFLQVKDDNVIVLAEYAVLPREVDATALSAEMEDLRRRLNAEAENEQLRRQLAFAEARQRLIQVG